MNPLPVGARDTRRHIASMVAPSRPHARHLEAQEDDAPLAVVANRLERIDEAFSALAVVTNRLKRMMAYAYLYVLHRTWSLSHPNG